MSAQPCHDSIYVFSSEADKAIFRIPHRREIRFLATFYQDRKSTSEELFVLVEREQQQAVKPFPAWTRVMEAEDLQMPSLWVHSWEPPWLSFQLLLLLPLPPLRGTSVLTPDL